MPLGLFDAEYISLLPCKLVE